MVSTGETAPDFTAPVANGDVETMTLSERLTAEAPVVLAFFPGAFTSVCSNEMSTFQDRLGAIAGSGGTLYGISVDTPFALNEFREQLSLSFDLISDTGREIIEEYDVVTDFEALGVERIAQRAVFVVDESGTITYAWVGENPGMEPDYDEVEAAVRDAS
jgi:peroxiredoxin